MSRRLRIALTALFAVAAGALVFAGGALAAFPGANGKIAFAHDPGTAGSSGDIFTIDPTGQNLTPLTGGPDYDQEPSYSADGEWIALSRAPAGTPNGEIWVMRADGSGQTQLTSLSTGEDRDPTFSPDGERIAFEHNTGATQIWIMDADGSGQTQLTFPGANPDEAVAVDPSVFARRAEDRLRSQRRIGRLRWDLDHERRRKRSDPPDERVGDIIGPRPQLLARRAEDRLQAQWTR